MRVSSRSVVVGVLFLLFLAGGVSSVPAALALQQEGGGDETVVTTRRTVVREGPGSFHQAIVVVKAEVPLVVRTRSDGWLRVRLPDDRTGWVSAARVQTGPAASATTRVGDDWTSAEATRTGVAAAVRGFQMHAEGLDQGSVEAFLSYLRAAPVLTEDDIEAFTAPVEAAEASDMDLDAFDGELSAYQPSVEARQVGMTVGARLASKGLVEAPRARRYLMLMAEHLTDDTPYYDHRFDIVLVEGAGPDAFACPGGTIVLTRGVFAHLETEAQLAGLLAHEIAHVVQGHGMTERAERDTRRRAESAFAEMERSMDDGADKFERAEADLEALARASYRRVVNDRLLRYEKEADRLAAALLGAAGYRPRGIVRAVEHITALRTHEPDLFDADYLTVQNLEARLEHVSAFVERHGGGEGARLRGRYRRHAAPLSR